MEDALPRSFEELGRRLGFTDPELRLRYGNNQPRSDLKGEPRESEHAEFMRVFGDSILYCAERDSAFCQHARAKALNRQTAAKLGPNSVDGKRVATSRIAPRTY